MATTRRCSVCGRAGHDKRQHGARPNPAPKLAGKTAAQLDAALERAEARVKAALTGWRGSKSKAENDQWKRKTRQADLEVEKIKNAISMLRFHEHYQAQRRVPAGPLSQLRLFNPKTVFIRFSVDKNGKRRAWKSYGGSQYLREFPIAVDKAELLISTGQATVTGGGKLRRVNPAGGWRVEERMNGLRGTLGPWRVAATNLDAERAERRAAAAIRQMSIGAARAVSPDGRPGPVHYSTARTAAIGRAGNPGNPDFYRDRFGRPHPVRGTPGYEDAFVGMSRADKRYLRSGSDQPRGGYTQEASGRALRVTAEKRRSTAKRDTTAGERLARGRTAAQKQAEANRRYRVMGA